MKKKRIISVFLVLYLIMSNLPVTSFAVEKTSTEEPGTVEPAPFSAADSVADGTVDIEDAMTVFYFVAKKIDKI